ncbi:MULTISPECIES: conjugative transposon protein TraN [Flavobacterium]|jgi:conjugative transposon TraN protein|uniref:Conjugative transposon protein TraN n=1 Tax=Flavobacterium frigoris (strain PS1) TaxID=1086011 RepID=H7FVJ1_FLAFP|nr:conjugative transposon protein TraN [Flavobacterium frigoris]EIA07413.1 conjugative transposon protein TraN [Flavobacterium frigoris PS1]|tara:strand:- start:2916 stop:3761 length:846 start_codon:yes stop_codon:yes gene_type:complete
MKKINVLLMGFLWVVSIGAFAQQTERNHFAEMESDSLYIGYSKTTTIVFPYTIKSVDKGSQDVLAQKAKGMENILHIKAAQQGFDQTNLTVITADAKLYSFVVNYDEESPQLNLSMDKVKSKSPEIYFSEQSDNEEELINYSKLAFYHKNKIAGAMKKKYEIKFQLNGIYIRDDILYYKTRVVNNSRINYDIDQLRFFIRDSRKIKRTASQEIEIIPILTHNYLSTINGESEGTTVFALPKFTIPDKKHLVIQLMEKNGGRHIELQLKNTKLLRLTVLPKL